MAAVGDDLLPTPGLAPRPKENIPGKLCLTHTEDHELPDGSSCWDTHVKADAEERSVPGNRRIRAHWNANNQPSGFGVLVLIAAFQSDQNILVPPQPSHSVHDIL